MILRWLTWMLRAVVAVGSWGAVLLGCFLVIAVVVSVVFVAATVASSRGLRSTVEGVCAEAVVGGPVDGALARARSLALHEYTSAGDTPATRRTILEGRRRWVPWYCVIEHADGVVVSTHTFGHYPWD